VTRGVTRGVTWWSDARSDERVTRGTDVRSDVVE